MKKLILFLFLSCLTLVAFSQERTVTKSMDVGATYYKYTGVSADTLTGNQDPIDVVFVYQGSGYVRKVAVKLRMDLIGTADTTYSRSVFGKEFNDDGTYIQIIAVAT